MQEKRTLSFESSTFHLLEEESEHEHEHTSTGEDDLLKLLSIPDDTQTWTHFDKRTKIYRTTHPRHHCGMTRIAIDDKIGTIMSLDCTKHTNEKDVNQNLPSVRDIRTLLSSLLNYDTNQQLKQSFQTFAAPPADEAKQVTKQTHPV